MSLNGVTPSFIPLSLNGLQTASFSNTDLGAASASSFQLTTATPSRLARFDANDFLVSSSIDQSDVALKNSQNTYTASNTFNNDFFAYPNIASRSGAWIWSAPYFTASTGTGSYSYTGGTGTALSTTALSFSLAVTGFGTLINTTYTVSISGITVSPNNTLTLEVIQNTIVLTTTTFTTGGSAIFSFVPVNTSSTIYFRISNPIYPSITTFSFTSISVQILPSVTISNPLVADSTSVFNNAPVLNNVPTSVPFSALGLDLYNDIIQYTPPLIATSITNNYIPKALGTNQLVNSQMFYDGSGTLVNRADTELGFTNSSSFFRNYGYTKFFMDSDYTAVAASVNHNLVLISNVSPLTNAPTLIFDTDNAHSLCSIQSKTWANAVLPLYLQISGGSTIIGGILTTGNRLLGSVDASPSGNFWIGLKGSGTELQRLAIAINGDSTTGAVSSITVNQNFYSQTLNPSNTLITSSTAATGFTAGANCIVNSPTTGNWKLQGNGVNPVNTISMNTNITLSPYRNYTVSLTLSGGSAGTDSSATFTYQCPLGTTVYTRTLTSPFSPGTVVTGTFTASSSAPLWIVLTKASSEFVWSLNWTSTAFSITENVYFGLTNNTTVSGLLKASNVVVSGTLTVPTISSSTSISSPIVYYTGVAGTNYIASGSTDTYNPTGDNNLMIRSWWGIGFKSYDDVVRAGIDTRTGDAQFSGTMTVGKLTAPQVQTSLSFQQSASYSLSTPGNLSQWYKLAYFNGTTATNFLLAWDTSGEHGNIYFTVSASYNGAPRLTITDSSMYGQAILYLRLSTDNSSIYNNNFVEFYTNSAFYTTVPLTVYILNQSSANNTMTLYTSLTTGTSSGYTYYQINTACGFGTIGGQFACNLADSYGQIRMIGGGYGTFIRNDGTTTYFLLTNSNDQLGSWNTLRPLYFSNTSGFVTMENGLSVSNYLYIQTTAVNNWRWGYPYVRGSDNLVRTGQSTCTCPIVNNVNDWAGGVNVVNAFYRANIYTSVNITGKFSYYSPGGMTYPVVRVYCQSSGATFYYTQWAYQNTGYQHTTYPFNIVINWAIHPVAGWYDIYIYNGGNCITDWNDTLECTVTVSCGGDY